jgi:hypothetical protein
MWLIISHPYFVNEYLCLILLFDIIHSMHCDYNHLYIPTNAHKLHKITVYMYMNSPACFSIKSCPHVNTKEYESNMSHSHTQC